MEEERVVELSPPISRAASRQTSQPSPIRERAAPPQFTPWNGDNATFRRLIHSYLYFEMSAKKTQEILRACRQFEREFLKLSLIATNPQKLIAAQQHNPKLMLSTARVAVLYGIVYYLGAEIPHNKEGDELARRYFDIGIAYSLTDAYVMAGIMARRGHGQPNGKPDLPLARHQFELAIVGRQHPEAYVQLADMYYRKEVLPYSDMYSREKIYPREQLQATREEQAMQLDNQLSAAIKILDQSIKLGNVDAAVDCAKIHMERMKKAEAAKVRIEAEKQKDKNNKGLTGMRRMNRYLSDYDRDIRGEEDLIFQGCSSARELLNIRNAEEATAKAALSLTFFQWTNNLLHEFDTQINHCKIAIAQGEPNAMMILADYLVLRNDGNAFSPATKKSTNLSAEAENNIKVKILEVVELYHRALMTFRRVRNTEQCLRLENSLTTLFQRCRSYPEVHYRYAVSIDPNALQTLARQDYLQCLSFILDYQLLSHAQKFAFIITTMGDSSPIAQDPNVSDEKLISLVRLCAQVARERLRLLTDIASEHHVELFIGLETMTTYAKLLLRTRLNLLTVRFNELKESEEKARAKLKAAERPGLVEPQPQPQLPPQPQPPINDEQGQEHPDAPEDVLADLPQPSVDPAALVPPPVVPPVNPPVVASPQRPVPVDKFRQLADDFKATRRELASLGNQFRLLNNAYQNFFKDVYVLEPNSSCRDIANVIRCLLGAFGTQRLSLPQDTETALQLVRLFEVLNADKWTVVKSTLLFDNKRLTIKALNIQVFLLSLLADVYRHPTPYDHTAYNRKVAQLQTFIEALWLKQPVPSTATLMKYVSSEAIKTDTLIRLEELVNFCAQLEHAIHIKPNEDPLVFERFFNEKNALYTELYKKFQTNSQVLYAIDEAVSLFLPQHQQTEGFLIFSAQINAERRRQKQREEQWQVAKQFQQRSDALIFDMPALELEICKFLMHRDTNKAIDSFARVLMEKLALSIGMKPPTGQMGELSSEDIKIFCKDFQKYLYPPDKIEVNEGNGFTL